MEAKKISFGFSKISKKPNLLPSKENVKEEPKVELIKCLEGQEIKLVEEKAEEKPLVIPLKDSQKTSAALASLMKRRAVLLGEEEPEEIIDANKEAIPATTNGDTEEDLEKRAARELLAETQKTLNGTDTTNNLVLPVVKPEDLPLDGAKESTLDDYESIPIQDFGKAMLRGMGWTEPPAKKNKNGIIDDMPVVRPKGMGLGADKALKKAPLLVAPEANEVLEVKRNAYVRILGGKHKDLYGQIEGFDDHAGRVIVKMAIGGAKEAFNEFLCQPVSRKEFSQYGKCINTTKYEEYKKKENEYGQIILSKEEKDHLSVKEEKNIKKESDIKNEDDSKYKKNYKDSKSQSKYDEQERVNRNRERDNESDRGRYKDDDQDRKRETNRNEETDRNNDKRDRREYKEVNDDRRDYRRDYKREEDRKKEYKREDDNRDYRRDNQKDEHKRDHRRDYKREEDIKERKKDYGKDYNDKNKQDESRNHRKVYDRYDTKSYRKYDDNDKDSHYDERSSKKYDDRNYSKSNKDCERSSTKDNDRQRERERDQRKIIEINDSSDTDSEDQSAKHKKSKKSKKKSKKSKKSKSKYKSDTSSSSSDSETSSSDSDSDEKHKKHKKKSKKSKKQRERSRSRGRR